MGHATLQLSQKRRWQYGILSVLLFIVVAFAIGEWSGWPFLGPPLERLLTERLERRVSFSPNISQKILTANKSDVDKFSIRFLGGVELHAPQLEIAAPTWSKYPYFLYASDVILELRYIDLWRVYRAQSPKIQHLRIQRLQATNLDSHLERQADGSASWQFGEQPTPKNQLIALPSFGSLQVTKGVLSYVDVPLDTNIDANFSFVNNEGKLETHEKIADSRLKTNNETNIVLQSNSTLQATASGSFQKLPLKIELVSTSQLPISDKSNPDNPNPNNSQANKPLTIPVALILNAKVGRATLDFKGNAVDALHMTDFSGKFNLKGPSLAAVGDLLGVTLPTTAEFTSGGFIDKKDSTWHVKLNNVDIGASHLNGDFTYEAGNRSVPLLSGSLNGSKLLLTDLGPALGAEPTSTKRNKVLPTRPFDLASLSAMDADVLIDIKYVDLNTSYLEPLRPLRGHLQLKEGILTLQDLDARTAEGKLKGDMSLDGRGSKALWDTNLRWSGVKLEHWVKQVRDDGLPPYISGQLNGQVVLKGQGVSTAEILATLKGNVRSELRDGAVSHFAIEVAGLDLAQALGVLFKGDESLPVQCAVFDLVADKGVFRPHVMVLDTKDSTVWVDGSLSLATEVLNLRAMVIPKDFSPLTLRSPLHINGSFAKPVVSLEKKPIGIKVASSLLLAIINPLAALIPLLDTGDTKEAKSHAAGCQDLMQRSVARTTSKTSNKVIPNTKTVH